MKLTEAQRRVLKRLGHGWESEPGAGIAIHVNGKRICNFATMSALSRLGLVEQKEVGGRKSVGHWKATQAGRNIADRLCL